MNGKLAESTELVRQLVMHVDGCMGVDVVVCPPFTAMSEVNSVRAGSIVQLGAQNAHFADKGAYTGEVSMPMLQDVGCEYVLIGHSERRQHNGEDDELIARKVAAAVDCGITPVLCVGETIGLRDAGEGEAHVLGQLARCLSLLRQQARNLVIAYEPVWAIGTGRAASASDANTMLGAVRAWLDTHWGEGSSAIRLLYGGSVTSENMASFAEQPHIDGALVGGASLKADSFAKIVKQTARGRANV